MSSTNNSNNNNNNKSPPAKSSKDEKYSIASDDLITNTISQPSSKIVNAAQQLHASTVPTATVATAAGSGGGGNSKENGAEYHSFVAGHGKDGDGEGNKQQQQTGGATNAPDGTDVDSTRSHPSSAVHAEVTQKRSNSKCHGDDDVEQDNLKVVAMTTSSTTPPPPTAAAAAVGEDEQLVTLEREAKRIVLAVDSWRTWMGKVGETECVASEQLDLILLHAVEIRRDLETEREKLRNKAKQLSACLKF